MRVILIRNFIFEWINPLKASQKTCICWINTKRQWQRLCKQRWNVDILVMLLKEEKGGFNHLWQLAELHSIEAEKTELCCKVKKYVMQVCFVCHAFAQSAYTYVTGSFYCAMINLKIQEEANLVSKQMFL